jgi:glycosyltransferase involved in cell wall biosynthesis
MNVRRRVLIVVPRLVAGGSEKVLSTIAGNLDGERFEIHLAVLGGVKAAEQAAVAAHIVVHELGLRHARYAGIGLLRLIWRLRPRIVVAAGGPAGVLATLVAKLAPRGTEIFLRQGTMPSASGARQKRWERRASSWSQRHADRVICQSTAMAGDVVRTSRVNPENVLVAYNPVKPAQNNVVAGTNPSAAAHLLGVGRLAPEKRLDLVIRAFAILKRQHHASATLTIVGDGPCRRSLEDLANSEDVAGSIRFVGYQQDPTAWMCDSHALVMASEFEGLPNVVLEAIAVGLPVIAIDCPGGIREIAETAANVALIKEETPVALARAMVETIASPPPRELPGAAFWERFGLKSVIRRYEQILSQ